MSRSTSSVMRGFGQAALGTFLLTTGVGHLTTKRKEFQAQVPSWFPADKDTVVVVSGYVELALAAVLLTTWRQPARRLLGTALAGFFVGIFPGNLAQYTERNDGLGLDTDRKRALRLLGQPALIAWVLAATREQSRRTA
jgi:uncharacterized membrane protein